MDLTIISIVLNITPILRTTQNDNRYSALKIVILGGIYFSIKILKCYGNENENNTYLHRSARPNYKLNIYLIISRLYSYEYIYQDNL